MPSNDGDMLSHARKHFVIRSVGKAGTPPVPAVLARCHGSTRTAFALVMFPANQGRFTVAPCLLLKIRARGVSGRTLFEETDGTQ